MERTVLYARAATAPHLPSRSLTLHRSALRHALHHTRGSFHALVRTLSDDDWSKHCRNTAWSVGELLAHLTLSLEIIPEQVERARRSRGMRNEPPMINHAINVMQSRLVARKESLQSIGHRYDAAHVALLAVLDRVKGDEWGHGGRFFHRYQTIEDLVSRPIAHFHDHAEQIREALKGYAGNSTA